MTVVCEPVDLEPASEEQGTQESKAGCQLVQLFYGGLHFYQENLKGLASGKRLKACLAFLQVKRDHKSYGFGMPIVFGILIILFHFYVIFPVFSLPILSQLAPLSFFLTICAVVDIQNSLLIQ